MGNFQMLLDGFAAAVTPTNLLVALLGVLLGTAVGVLPGIGPAMTVALLLPVAATFDDPAAALIMFAGIYYGGMYGGSTTSILLNTPGESASIVTALEGNQMAKNGQGAAALATAAIGSFVAGTIGTVLLSVVGPSVAQIAIHLGAADYVALMVLAFLTVGAMLGSSISRGMASLALGLVLGIVGTDLVSGQSRLTFGLPDLTDGIDVVLVAVGLFAVGEALYVASRLRRGPVELVKVSGKMSKWLSKADFKLSWKPWLRGSAIGFPIGTIPAGGADVSTFLSYAAERRLAKGERKALFGKGAIEGVAGPEAANNAAAAGVLVPLLTLGLPTSATAAMILVAFQQFQIYPGAHLFTSPETAPMVWALIASLYIGNVMLLILNLPLVGLWVRILQIPRPYLYAGILTFAALGAFAVGRRWQDVVLLLILGIVGYFMRRFGYPVGPMVIGLILGPMFEVQLRTALQISNGNWGTLIDFAKHPFAVVVYVVLLVLLLVSQLLKYRERRLNEQLSAEVGATELETIDVSSPALPASGASSLTGTSVSAQAPGVGTGTAVDNVADGPPRFSRGGAQSGPAPSGSGHNGATETDNPPKEPRS